MKVRDFFQLNDIDFGTFAIIVISWLMAILSLSVWVFNSPIIGLIRAIIIIPFLLFIPGIIILRLLKLHDLGRLKTIVYSLGLSISVLMFSGALLNLILYNQSREPITPHSLSLFLSLVCLLALCLAYLRDHNFSLDHYVSTDHLLRPFNLYLVLLPLISIVGTYIMNNYANGILLEVLIIILSITPLFSLIKNRSTTEYPAIIFSVTLALLLHRALLSDFVWGWDIQQEYYLANQVVTNAQWNPAIPNSANAMLSIVIVAPSLTVMTGMDLNWVFKIIYPFIFTFVPICMYLVFKKEVGEKVAFLSIFFFISIFTFYVEMISLARQEIGELIFALLILTILDSFKNKNVRIILIGILLITLAISYYGLTYLFLGYVAIIWFIVIICHLWDRLYHKKSYADSVTKYLSTKLVNPYLFAIFVVFVVVWYFSTAESTLLNTLSSIINVFSNIRIENFFNTGNSQSLIIATQETTPMREIALDMHLILLGFVALGVIFILFKKSHIKISDEYSLLVIASFLIMLAGMVVPYFSRQINSSRLYHIGLITLAPMSLIGMYEVGHIISWLTRRRFQIKGRVLNIAFAIFCAVFLLFNSGLVLEWTNDNPTSTAFNANVDFPQFTRQEVETVSFIQDHNSNLPVYADNYRALLITREMGPASVIEIPFSQEKIRNGSLIFLGNYNIKNSEMLILQRHNEYFEMNYVSTENISQLNKIYSNGGAQINQYLAT